MGQNNEGGWCNSQDGWCAKKEHFFPNQTPGSLSEMYPDMMSDDNNNTYGNAQDYQVQTNSNPKKKLRSKVRVNKAARKLTSRRNQRSNFPKMYLDNEGKSDSMDGDRVNKLDIEVINQTTLPEVLNLTTNIPTKILRKCSFRMSRGVKRINEIEDVDVEPNERSFSRSSSFSGGESIISGSLSAKSSFRAYPRTDSINSFGSLNRLMNRTNSFQISLSRSNSMLYNGLYGKNNNNDNNSDEQQQQQQQMMISMNRRRNSLDLTRSPSVDADDDFLFLASGFSDNEMVISASDDEEGYQSALPDRANSGFDPNYNFNNNEEQLIIDCSDCSDDEFEAIRNGLQRASMREHHHHQQKKKKKLANVQYQEREEEQQQQQVYDVLFSPLSPPSSPPITPPCPPNDMPIPPPPARHHQPPPPQQRQQQQQPQYYHHPPPAMRVNNKNNNNNNGSPTQERSVLKKRSGRPIALIEVFQKNLSLVSNPSHPWASQGGIILENVYDSKSIIEISLSNNRRRTFNLSELRFQFELFRVGQFRGVGERTKVSFYDQPELIKGINDGSIFKPFHQNNKKKNTAPRKRKKKRNYDENMTNPHFELINSDPGGGGEQKIVMTFRLNHYDDRRKVKGIMWFGIRIFAMTNNQQQQQQQQQQMMMMIPEWSQIRHVGYYFKKDNRKESKIHHFKRPKCVFLKNM